MFTKNCGKIHHFSWVNYGKSSFLMGKRWKTHYFNGHGFNSKLFVSQRVTGYEYPEAQSKSKFQGQSSNGRSIESTRSTSTNPPAGLASNKPSENQTKNRSNS
jgi:hypothetical protein